MCQEKRDSKKQKVIEERVSSPASEDEEDAHTEVVPVNVCENTTKNAFNSSIESDSEENEDISSWNQYLPLNQSDEDENRSGLISTRFRNVNMAEAESSVSENETQKLLTEKVVKSIQATKPQSNSSKRSIIIDSDTQPEPKRPKITISHVDSLDVSNDLDDSEVNNKDEHKTTDRVVQRISLRNIRKQSCSKNDTAVDEDIIFVKKVKGDKHLIQNNQMDDLKRMYIFSKDATFVGKRLAISIKKENTPQPDKENLG